MSDQAAKAHQPKRTILQSLELDLRLLGMVAAFLVICLSFNLMTEGRFLAPRNIFNLTIQTVSVAIMATGTVFVIVTRNIDLSVGALLATCTAVMGMAQTAWLPQLFGLELGHPLIPWLTIALGLVTGAAIGAAQGWLIGYQAIPAFIVTVGGLLIWRNVGWHLTDGATVGPLDKTFVLFGGINGTLGAFWSWVLGLIATAAALAAMSLNRRGKLDHGVPVKPLWAQATMMVIVAGAIMGFVAILNAYPVPPRVIARNPALFGCETANGCVVAYGIPYSVLVLSVVAVVMTVIAQRTRLGRYIFATGGNPNAAELSGINTRLLTVKIFAMLGTLCALAGIVASARLGYHTNDLGTLDELRVIAAAVIGGAALSGGVGTIYGAIIGALIMQTLQSGMAMVGVTAPYQNIIIGAVLIAAVWIDVQCRKRSGGKFR